VIHPPYTNGADGAGMSNYRRAAVPGAVYFFIVALAVRRSRVLVEQADALRAAFVATAREHPVRVDAMVVLPDLPRTRSGGCPKVTPTSRRAGAS